MASARREVSNRIADELGECGIGLVASLPDDWVADLIKVVEVDDRFIHVPVNREEFAVGLCSGTFFSYAGFPEILHPFIRLLPLTALNDALRAVITEGSPLLASWVEILVLIFWGGLSFFLALRFFRWQ